MEGWVIELQAQCAEVQKYYDENSQMEWERLERHPFELPLTLYMMEKYIRPGDRVLDIGGGPGRYSIHFAKMGCDVTLVDLSPGNIRFAQQKAAEAGVKFAAYAANCLELDKLNLGEFDHVLLMGPLYHLKEDDDRKKAVEQALLQLKTGGNLYASFILNFAGAIYDLKNGGYVEQDFADGTPTAALIDDILQGMKDSNTPRVVEPDRRAAIRYALAHGQPGDVIVLAGKGHEDYQEIRGVKYPMDERVLISEVLEEIKEGK